MKFGSIFETSYGIGIIVASESGISRVLLPGFFDGTVDSLAIANLKPSLLTENLSEKLNLYFSGKRQSFNNIAIDLSGITAFRSDILKLVINIAF